MRQRLGRDRQRSSTVRRTHPLRVADPTVRAAYRAADMRAPQCRERVHFAISQGRRPTSGETPGRARPQPDTSTPNRLRSG